MFGDAYSTAAFDAPQAVAVGVLAAAIVATFGLYLLGLPLGLTGIAFVVVALLLLFLAMPLFQKVRPEFEHADYE